VSNGWKDILARSGDENLGATLIRLARQAAALRQYQTAFAIANDGSKWGRTPLTSPSGSDGSAGAGPDSWVPVLTDDVRREVDA